VLIFILAQSHTAKNWSAVCWRPCWRFYCQQYQIVCKNLTVDFAVPNHDTVVDSAVTIYSMHIRLWQGVVTAHTLVGVQYQQWTVMI